MVDLTFKWHAVLDFGLQHEWYVLYFYGGDAVFVYDHIDREACSMEVESMT